LSRQNVNEPQVVNTQTFEIGHHRAFFGVINPEAHYVDLTISDDGSGMSRDVVEHIFEPFFTTKGVHEGTGLGLSAAQGVILNHKGVMVVDTIEGQGTSFHILLPYDQSDMPIASDTQSASRTDSCQANLFVVIDDQENVLDVASTMLSRLGYETKSFSNGRDALSFIKGNSDDICGVLTDENMPSMLGSDLAKSLLDVNPLIPVFIMTGFAKTLSPKRRSNLPNVKDIIQKPLVKATLKTMLSKKL